MPLPLPNLPAVDTPLPPQLQDPPTLVDISNAIAYNKQVLVSHEAGVDTKDQVGAGVVYQAALIAHNGGAVAPPWFAPALAAGLAPLTRVAHISHNLLAGGGRARPFEIVPFLDGTLPTGPQHNLPPLVDVGVINALTGPQATAYLVGYGQPVPIILAARQKAIRIAVGCTVEM